MRVRREEGAAAETGPLLRLRSITKAYPGVVANDGVSLDLRAGEIHAIVGENGAGKSTLMGIVYGLHRADAGEMSIDGRPVAIASPRDALDLGIGYVQQHFSLIPTLTVAQNLILAIRSSTRRIRPRDGEALVRELSSRYGLEVEPNAVVEDLSVGQQQRAELLKALARDARILLLDEPNALLTPQEWEALAVILRRLADDGVGLFLISHKLEEVVRVSDRISVMRRGRVVETIPAAEATHLQLAELMIGELGAAARDPEERARSEGAPLLQVEDLWVRDDRGSHAVRGVSLTVRPGEIVGLAGVEGSGQLELTEAIAGVRPVERGRIRVDGREVTTLRVRQRQAQGIAHVPADRLDAGLVPTLTIAENLALPVLGDPALSRAGTLRLGALTTRARSLIDRFNIATPGPDLEARALSGGNQQKLVLARELARDPRVLVCCYPTRGLDFSATEAVEREIVERRESGAAILYASVELGELLGLTDRIIVLHNGALTGELPPSEATAEQLGLLMGGAAA